MTSQTEQKLVKAGQLTAGILGLEALHLVSNGNRAPRMSLPWLPHPRPPAAVTQGMQDRGSGQCWRQDQAGDGTHSSYLIWYMMSSSGVMLALELQGSSWDGALFCTWTTWASNHAPKVLSRTSTYSSTYRKQGGSGTWQQGRTRVEDLGSGVRITGPHTRQVCLHPVMPKGLTLYSRLAPQAQGCCLSPQSTGMASVGRHAPAGSKPQRCGQRMVLDNSEQNSANNALCCQKLLL